MKVKMVEKMAEDDANVQHLEKMICMYGEGVKVQYVGEM